MSRPRCVGLGALLLLGVLLQVTTVGRLPLPGSGRPELALLLVAVVALVGGPRIGLVSGFGAGLTLDLAPPAAHPVGQWAFVACALGYAVGLAAPDARRSLLLPAALAGTAAALAPVAFTVLGGVLGDPRADVGAALTRVPQAFGWTLLLAPAAFVGVRRLVRGSARAGSTWAAPAHAHRTVHLGPPVPGGAR